LKSIHELFSFAIEEASKRLNWARFIVFHSFTCLPKVLTT